MDRVLAKHTVAVLGSGTDEHDDLAREIGSLLARIGVNLLTGGGRGVMTSVSRSYVQSPRVSATVIVALPGELGTASEVSLAVDYGRPIIAYASDAHLVDHFVSSVPRATTLREVEDFLIAKTP
ncbi:MAG TPA: hypothetical protein VF105_06380 [Gemmatimonadaceae bacterium]